MCQFAELTNPEGSARLMGLMKPMRRAFLAILLLPAAAGAESLEMARNLSKGLDEVYAMRFSEAEADVRLAIAADQQHPYGYFGLAAVSMIKYVYGSEQADPGLLEEFSRRIDDAIVKGEAWRKLHPRDPEGFMALGAAYGLSARLQVVRRDWIRAFWHGRKAVAFLQSAVKYDPAMGDPWLGLGMYDYYADAYPRFIRVLAKFVMRGDRARGVAELRRAAAIGRYSQVVSQLILIEIFLEDQWGLRDPAEAMRLSAAVRCRYPDSAMIQNIDIIARYEGGRYDEVLAEADAFLAQAEAGNFDVMQLAKAHVIKGTTLWAMNRPNEALQEYDAAAEVRAEGQITRWGVWAQIRAGNLLDSLGRRELAQARYRIVAAAPDRWGLRQFACAGLRAPWPDSRPGHISPFGA